MVPPPPPVAPPPPPPIAASVVIETRKIIKDYLSDVVLDFNEWVSADTLIIRPGLTSPVIRVTAKQEDGNPVTDVEPVVRFSTGTDAVTYRTLVGDSLKQISLQRESHQYWTIFDGGTPAETQILTVTARLGDVANSLVVVYPTTLDVATDPQTLPEGVSLDDVGERVSTPLNWFTSRAGAAEISYEFHVGETPDDDDSGPAILGVMQNGNGELEIAAVGRGRRYLHYRALSSAFELRTGRILTAVDDCYPPELERRPVYDRASTGFRVDLVYEEPENWSRCAKVLMDHAVGFFEAALKDNTSPPDFRVFVFDGVEDCAGSACGGPRGTLVDRGEGAGVYFPAGGLYWPVERPYAPGPFGRVPDNVTYETMLHELAHAFGIGTYWWYSGVVQVVNLPSGGGTRDTHFPGPNAVAAFDEAGGSGYLGGKVPLTNYPDDTGGHWRAVLCGEIMTRGYCPVTELNFVSAITLAALADFGWVVDMSVAEDYTLPSRDMAASVQADTVSGHDDVLIRVEPRDRR